MARYSIGDFIFGKSVSIGFAQFVDIVKGRSIVSALDTKGRAELGLSGDMMIRISRMGKELDINVVSTTNLGEIPPITIVLGDLPQRVPMHVIEDKLNGLRTLHAICFLSENERTSDLVDYLTARPDGDIERDLLDNDDCLFVESLSYGSWVLTVWSKTTAAYKSISTVAGMVFERSRESYLRKVEAEASILENQAQKEAIQAAKENFELQKSQMDYLLDISNKIDAPEIKELVKRRITESVEKLVSGDPEIAKELAYAHNPESNSQSKMLPPPK